MRGKSLSANILFPGQCMQEVTIGAYWTKSDKRRRKSVPQSPIKPQIGADWRYSKHSQSNQSCQPRCAIGCTREISSNHVWVPFGMCIIAGKPAPSLEEYEFHFA